jgi:hypothetical protein
MSAHLYSPARSHSSKFSASSDLPSVAARALERSLIPGALARGRASRRQVQRQGGRHRRLAYRTYHPTTGNTPSIAAVRTSVRESRCSTPFVMEDATMKRTHPATLNSSATRCGQRARRSLLEANALTISGPGHYSTQNCESHGSQPDRCVRRPYRIGDSAASVARRTIPGIGAAWPMSQANRHRSVSSERDYSAFEYLPFRGGSRRCLGADSLPTR